MPKSLFFLFILSSYTSSAQKIYGTVFSDKGDLLPYASITIKGTSVGASANNKARFSFFVSPGTYTVVCQHIGYRKQEKVVTVTNADAEVTFVIAKQELDMTEVIIKSGEEDPAYAIIRQAIKKRPFYNEQVKGFEVELYTKDIMKLRNLPKKYWAEKFRMKTGRIWGLILPARELFTCRNLLQKYISSNPTNLKWKYSAAG